MATEDNHNRPVPDLTGIFQWLQANKALLTVELLSDADTLIEAGRWMKRGNAFSLDMGSILDYRCKATVSCSDGRGAYGLGKDYADAVWNAWNTVSQIRAKNEAQS